MIIVEGTDCVGKSTLCKKLLEKLHDAGVPSLYMHFPKIPANWDYFHDYQDYMHQNIMLDRFYMSEAVYGDICRNGSRITKTMYRQLDGLIRQVPAVTVVITAEHDWLKEHLNKIYEGREELYDKQVILNVNEGFLKVIDASCGMECDWDYHYHIGGPDNIATDSCEYSSKMPSSNEAFIEKVIEEYALRLENHEPVH